MKATDGFNTKLVHAGEPRPAISGAVTTPVFQSSTFEFLNPQESGQSRYIRSSNTPNHDVLHGKLAALEGGEAGLVSTSGMAAISSVLVTLCGHGEHVLAQDNLYGGSYYFFRDEFPALGRTSSYFPMDEKLDLAKYVKPETKVIYVESISNPLMKVPDLQAIAKFGKERGIYTVIDSTFTSPYNFTPLAMGFDVVLHSATKYLNGHSDLVAGAVVSTKELVAKIAHRQKNFGGSLDPHACYLLNRGMKTLSLRMKCQNESALKLAEFLETHPKVAKVNYPGLASHPSHARAREWFRGFGGMLSFEYAGSVPEMTQFLKRLRLPYLAPSLGGLETLCVCPVMTSHADISPKERERLGIKDTLIRVSVGIEETDDLIKDFSQALEGN